MLRVGCRAAAVVDVWATTAAAVGGATLGGGRRAALAAALAAVEFNRRGLLKPRFGADLKLPRCCLLLLYTSDALTKLAWNVCLECGGWLLLVVEGLLLVFFTVLESGFEACRFFPVSGLVFFTCFTPKKEESVPCLPPPPDPKSGCFGIFQRRKSEESKVR